MAVEGVVLEGGIRKFHHVVRIYQLLDLLWDQLDDDVLSILVVVGKCLQ